MPLFKRASPKHKPATARQVRRGKLRGSADIKISHYRGVEIMAFHRPSGALEYGKKSVLAPFNVKVVLPGTNGKQKGFKTIEAAHKFIDKLKG